MQAVRCTRFLDGKIWRATAPGCGFNERAAAELLEQATALMAQAKSCHDELETYYRTTVDFAQVDEAAPGARSCSGWKRRHPTAEFFMIREVKSCPTSVCPIRQLVEFLLRSGSIDSRFAGFDRALEGARIHRRAAEGRREGYAAEVPLCADYTVDGIRFTLEGRADGIFTNETGVVTIDEIKTTAVPEEEICEDMNPCHWAQGMVYGAIYSAQENCPPWMCG